MIQAAAEGSRAGIGAMVCRYRQLQTVASNAFIGVIQADTGVIKAAADCSQAKNGVIQVEGSQANTGDKQAAADGSQADTGDIKAATEGSQADTGDIQAAVEGSQADTGVIQTEGSQEDRCHRRQLGRHYCGSSRQEARG